MRLGRLHIGWRPLLADEAKAFGILGDGPLAGFFIEWGDEENGFGVCLKIKPQR